MAAYCTERQQIDNARVLMYDVFFFGFLRCLFQLYINPLTPKQNEVESGGTATNSKNKPADYLVRK